MNELLESICDTNGYDNNLKKVIFKLFNIMVDYYGVSRIDDILKVFKEVKIVVVPVLTREIADMIREKITKNTSKNYIDLDDDTPYANNQISGSCYSIEPILNIEEDPIIKEKRWIIVKNVKYSKNSLEYENIFETDICIPFLIHELGHAIGTSKPLYKLDNDIIYSKHGMVEEACKINYDKEKNSYVLKNINSKYMILEEIINEVDTEEMLCRYLNITDVNVLRNLLTKIGFPKNNYSNKLLDLGYEIKKIFQEHIFELRINNDMKYKDDFNNTASKSPLYKNIEMLPYDELNKRAYNMYILNYKRSILDDEKYNSLMEEEYNKAMIPVNSYYDAKNNKNKTAF